METILILLSIGVLAFLGKVGMIAFEVLPMDFNFDKPWPEDTPQSGQEISTKKPPVPSDLPVRKAWLSRFIPSASLPKA
ncbi:MAG: hypothetical protein WA958_17425 [Tunicatimonas sp.]